MLRLLCALACLLLPLRAGAADLEKLQREIVLTHAQIVHASYTDALLGAKALQTAVRDFLAAPQSISPCISPVRGHDLSAMIYLSQPFGPLLRDWTQTGGPDNGDFQLCLDHGGSGPVLDGRRYGAGRPGLCKRNDDTIWNDHDVNDGRCDHGRLQPGPFPRDHNLRRRFKAVRRIWGKRFSRCFWS